MPGNATAPAELSCRERVSKRPRLAAGLTWGLLGLALAALLLASRNPVAAQPSIRYVATSGADSGGCTEMASPCRTLQYAVDAANERDVVKVAAGLYTDVHERSAPPNYQAPPGVSHVVQVVYISKTITIRGGYDAAGGFRDPPHPETRPTTLDARRQGRVLFVTGDVSPTIEGLSITGGDAFWLGGGLWDEDTGGGVYIHQSPATLSGNVIAQNWAYSGGGLYLYNSGATLANNHISANLSYGSGSLPAGGGGAYLLSGGATLDGNTIAANRAQGGGGGIQLFNSDGTTLEGNAFVANVAGMGGALLLLYSDALVEGNTVISNSASLGGGLCLPTEGNSRISQNTIVSNSATLGGGLYLSGTGASINENTILSNVADQGGGLYLARDAASLSRNIIRANVADRGAGLALSYSSATLSNTLLAGNLGNWGSGLFAEGSSPRLLHSTIVGGSGLGSGIWITPSREVPCTIWLTNTILVSHAVGISAVEGATATLAATLWGTGTWANDADWSGAGTIATGTVNLREDPAFVNPSSGDYRLGPGSTAIDLGLDTGVEADLDGEVRPIGAAADIGADEAGLLVGKWATPARVLSGAVLTYTLRITNASNVAMQATITDILPAQVTATRPLVWTSLIAPGGGAWAETLTVTVQPGHAGPVTNLLQATTEQGARGSARVAVTAVLRIYLPLVRR